MPPPAASAQLRRLPRCLYLAKNFRLRSTQLHKYWGRCMHRQAHSAHRHICKTRSNKQGCTTACYSRVIDWSVDWLVGWHTPMTMRVSCCLAHDNTPHTVSFTGGQHAYKSGNAWSHCRVRQTAVVLQNLRPCQKFRGSRQPAISCSWATGR